MNHNHGPATPAPSHGATMGKVTSFGHKLDPLPADAGRLLCAWCRASAPAEVAATIYFKSGGAAG